MILEARDRLVYITWPIWFPVWAARRGEWQALAATLVWGPLIFPFGVVIHVGWFAYNLCEWRGDEMKIRDRLLDVVDVLACALMLVVVALLIGTTGCSDDRADDPFEQAQPTDENAKAYRAASERMVRDHFDGSRIISRDPTTGEVRHKGDGLIWDGIAMAYLPCDLGAPLEAAMVAELVARDGILSRHADLPDSVSADGIIGFYRGVVERVVRCGAADAWREPMRLHLARLEANDWHPNPADSARLEYGIEALARLAASLVGVGSAPNTATLERSMVLWAKANKTAYDLWKRGLYPNPEPPACYRMNLGWTALTAIEAAGMSVSSKTRDGFCAATTHAGLPTVDHWCGRTHLVDWTSTFQFNEWEYRHQRCTEWESPDGNGLVTPGLDYVVGMREAYKQESTSWQGLKSRWTF